MATAALLVAIAAADMLLAEELLLPTLLAIVPVIAAAALSPRRVSVFALAATATTAALGFPDHNFFTASHAVAVGVIAAVGGMAIIVARLRGDLESALAVAEERATHDVLTGLLRRSAALDRLDAILTVRAPQRPSITLVMADVDDFKSINDEFGHPVGDEVLQAVSARLVGLVREGDLVCRYGGEEFLLALAGGEFASAELVDRLVAEIDRAPVVTQRGDVKVTISAGWTEVGDATDVLAALTRADDALYQAKRAGKNRAIAYAGVHV